MGGGFALRGLAMLLLGMMGDAYGLRRAFEVSAVLMFAGVLLVFKIPKGGETGDVRRQKKAEGKRKKAEEEAEEQVGGKG